MYRVHWKCLNCLEVHEAQTWYGNHKCPGCPNCSCDVYENVGFIHGYEDGKPVYKPESPTGRYVKFKKAEPIGDI